MSIDREPRDELVATVLHPPRPAHRQLWDAVQDAVLRRMVEEGALIGDIAEALGRTREGVRNRANLMGLSVRSSPGQGRRRVVPLPPQRA